MKAIRLLARCPAKGAERPKRGSAPTLTLSMAKTVTFSVAIDSQAVGTAPAVPSHCWLPDTSSARCTPSAD